MLRNFADEPTELRSLRYVREDLTTSHRQLRGLTADLDREWQVLKKGALARMLEHFADFSFYSSTHIQRRVNRIRDMSDHLSQAIKAFALSEALLTYKLIALEIQALAYASQRTSALTTSTRGLSAAVERTTRIATQSIEAIVREEDPSVMYESKFSPSSRVSTPSNTSMFNRGAMDTVASNKFGRRAGVAGTNAGSPVRHARPQGSLKRVPDRFARRNASTPQHSRRVHRRSQQSHVTPLATLRADGGDNPHHHRSAPHIVRRQSAISPGKLKMTLPHRPLTMYRGKQGAAVSSSQVPGMPGVMHGGGGGMHIQPPQAIMQGVHRGGGSPGARNIGGGGRVGTGHGNSVTTSNRQGTLSRRLNF